MLLAATSQLNHSPSIMYHQTYIVCIHSGDKEVVLGSMKDAPDMGCLLAMMVTIAKHCPDVAEICPDIDLTLRQADDQSAINAIFQKGRYETQINEMLGEFRAKHNL